MSSIVREQLQFQMIPRCLLLLVLKSSIGFLQSHVGYFWLSCRLQPLVIRRKCKGGTESLFSVEVQEKINQGWSLTVGQLKLCLCVLMQGIPTEMGMGTLQACHLITKRFHDSGKNKIAEISHKNNVIFLVLYSSVFLRLLTQSLDTG